MIMNCLNVYYHLETTGELVQVVAGRRVFAEERMTDTEQNMVFWGVIHQRLEIVGYCYLLSYLIHWIDLSTFYPFASYIGKAFAYWSYWLFNWLV